MLTRIRQLAAKIESNEGTAETLAAADAKLLAYNPKISFDPSLYENDPVRASFGKLGKIVGKRQGSCAFKTLLQGSGTAATAPEIGKYWKACGFSENVIKSINIGAITGGPFQHGETITGGTSGGKGRVVINTATGAAAVMYVVISGTLQTGEVITGGTSAATATTSSSATTVGNEYKPVTPDSTYSNISSLSMATLEDGVKKLLAGARGKFKLAFKTGAPGENNFDFQGVDGGVTDVALLSSISYPTTKPPAFLNATLSIGSYSAIVSSLDLDIANTLALRDDVNSAKGLKSCRITGRDISGSFDPEMALVAGHDFFGSLVGGTEMILDFTLGSAAGNKFRFYAPRVQYNKVDDEDREGMSVAKCTFDLNGSLVFDDSELSILAL